MAGSLSLCGDVTWKPDVSDTITVNGAISDCLGSHYVERSDVEHWHGWCRQRGNRLRDDLRFKHFIDALTVTGAAYVQGAVTLVNEATDLTAVAGRHDLRCDLHF